MSKKSEIRLKLSEGETRVLNKIAKWNQLALDSRALCEGTENLTLQRLHEIEDMIKNVKGMTRVPEIAQVKDQIEIMKDWDAKILAVTGG